jgi:hypothetical protein
VSNFTQNSTGGGRSNGRRVTTTATTNEGLRNAAPPQLVAIVRVPDGVQFHHAVGTTVAGAETALQQVITSDSVVLAKMSAARFRDMAGAAAESAAKGAGDGKKAYAAFFGLAGVALMVIAPAPSASTIGAAFGQIPPQAGTYICTFEAASVATIQNHFASQSGHSFVHLPLPS